MAQHVRVNTRAIKPHAITFGPGCNLHHPMGESRTDRNSGA